MESWWHEQTTGKQKLVKDCAPKRLMLDSQANFNRSIAIQGAVDKLENRIARLETLLELLIKQSQQVLTALPEGLNLMLPHNVEQ